MTTNPIQNLIFQIFNDFQVKKRSYANVVAVDLNNKPPLPNQHLQVSTSKPFLDTPDHSKFLQQQLKGTNSPKPGVSPSVTPKIGVTPAVTPNLVVTPSVTPNSGSPNSGVSPAVSITLLHTSA